MREHAIHNHPEKDPAQGEMFQEVDMTSRGLRFYRCTETQCTFRHVEKGSAVHANHRRLTGHMVVGYAMTSQQLQLTVRNFVREELSCHHPDNK